VCDVAALVVLGVALGLVVWVLVIPFVVGFFLPMLS